MDKWHIDIHGEPVRCPAEYKCRAKGGPVDADGNVEHFEGTLEEAREWAEKKNKEEAGGLNMPESRTKDVSYDDPNKEEAKNIVLEQLNLDHQRMESIFYGEHRFGLVVFELHQTRTKEIRKVYKQDTDSFYRVTFRRKFRDPNKMGNLLDIESFEPSDQDLMECLDARTEWAES